MKYQPLTKEDIEDFGNLIYLILINDYEDDFEDELKNSSQSEILNEDAHYLRFSKFIELIKSGEILLDEYFIKIKSIIKYSDEDKNTNINDKFVECFEDNFFMEILSSSVSKSIVFQILENLFYVKECIKNDEEVDLSNIYESFYFFISYEYINFITKKIHNFVYGMSDYEKYVYIKEEIIPQFSD